MKDTKERILKVAAELFAKQGLRRTSIRDISLRAHVAKGALYYYFKNKQDVFVTILRKEIEEVWQKTRTAVDAEKDPARKLSAYLTKVTTEIRKSVLIHEAMNDDFLEHIETIEKILMQIRKKEIDMLVGIIKSGISDGLFEEVDVHRTAQAIVYAFEGLLDSPMIHEPDILGDAKQPGLLPGLILDGLRTR